MTAVLLALGVAFLTGIVVSLVRGHRRDCREIDAGSQIIDGLFEEGLLDLRYLPNPRRSPD